MQVVVKDPSIGSFWLTACVVSELKRKQVDLASRNLSFPIV